MSARNTRLGTTLRRGAIGLGLVVVLVFAGGVALGWAVSPGAPASENEPRVVTVRDGAHEDALEKKIALLEAYRDTLVSENRDMVGRIAALVKAQIDAEERAIEFNAPPRTEDEGEALEPGPASEQREARERRRQRAEQWRERFEGQAREMWAEQFAAIDDPAALESLEALSEWRDYQQEMRRQLREMESEEDRNAVLVEMEEARWNAQQLVNDQQDSVLRAFAEEQGIAGETEQAQFVAQLRETLQDPFFLMERMLVGGGPRGGRGFGSRGFRPPENR